MPNAQDFSWSSNQKICPKTSEREIDRAESHRNELTVIQNVMFVCLESWQQCRCSCVAKPNILFSLSSFVRDVLASLSLSLLYLLWKKSAKWDLMQRDIWKGRKTYWRLWERDCVCACVREWERACAERVMFWSASIFVQCPCERQQGKSCVCPFIRRKNRRIFWWKIVVSFSHK